MNSIIQKPKAHKMKTSREDGQRTGRPDEPPLSVLLHFFDCLNEQKIRYCQWKSTGSLPRALRGKTDFDLLVDREHAQRFRNALTGCDFRPAVSHARRQFPAIEDYLGFDRRTGRLAHLHLHYQLVMGQEFVKNYYLPLERAFLENTQWCGSVRVPLPELEIIVLVLRALVKYRDRDIVRDVLRLGATGGLPQTTLDEIRHLRTLTTDEQILCAVERHVPFVAPELVDEFLDTVQHAPRSGSTLYRLRRSVRDELKPYRRFGAWGETRTYWKAMLEQMPPLNRFSREERRKIPTSGGLTLAFVGADGAGKSTVVQELARWLGWRLNVQTLYMGTTRPSAATKIARAIATIAAIPHAASRRAFGKQNPLTQLTGELEQWSVYARCLSEGRDRYNRYCVGRRKAARGNIVIFDRYPLQHVLISGRSMDGPRIASMNSGHPRGITKKTAAIEERMYKRILPPDQLFVLQVSAAVSQARKPDHDHERIQAKSRALAELQDADQSVVSIDAGQPLEDVLLQIKTKVWSLI